MWKDACAEGVSGAGIAFAMCTFYRSSNRCRGQTNNDVAKDDVIARGDRDNWMSRQSVSTAHGPVLDEVNLSSSEAGTAVGTRCDEKRTSRAT